jgi:hypothetical protein
MLGGDLTIVSVAVFHGFFIVCKTAFMRFLGLLW